MAERKLEREFEIPICASDALVDGGTGVRFQVATPVGSCNAFAIRFDGRAYAYLNRCAHVASELDWQPGEFFDHTGLYLVCATHGALYEPESGRCQGGPCNGGSLRPIAIIERDSFVYWLSDSDVFPVAPLAD